MILIAAAWMAVPADAQNAPAIPSAKILGIIADQINGLPIPNAQVELYSADSSVSKTKSDEAGNYLFENVNPGIYTLVVQARGFASGRSNEFAVLPASRTTESIVLTRSSVSDQNLKTIGTVVATGGSPLAATTNISRSIDTNALHNENYLRFGDALRTLPGVNFAGLSSSVGDDLYVDIRGLGETETQALLDGHPVGPQGVYGINRPFGTFPGAFNYADTPFFGLSKVQVTFGTGATGLYGTDVTGGTIDMQTLNPTPTRQFTIEQGIGSRAKTQTDFRATGMISRLGYAFAGSVQGTDGLYSPQLIPQTGRPNNSPNSNNGGACTSGNDLTTCNLALNTYQISQQTTLKSGLAKLSYALSKNTTLTGSWFGSGQWADSTGNGDNDNIPYDTRVAQISTNNTPNCSLPSDPAGTMTGFTVITDSNPSACYTAAQFAAASSGPFGGGAGRNRGTSMFDYHARLQSVNGHSTYAADWFFNHYKFTKSSQEAGGLDPSGTMFQGSEYAQFLNTTGFLLSDSITNEKSDFGFGYFTEHQLQTRLDYNTVGLGLYNYDTPQAFGYGSVFGRASVTMSPRFSVFANLWLKNSNVTHSTYFDPRLSVVFRPSSNRDVLRLTYGQSTGIPAPETIFSPPIINGNPSSLNPSCTPFNTVGSAGNPNVKPENSKDVELGFAHRFQDDSNIQLNLYTTSITNQLFAASLPLTQYGSLAINPALLAGFASKIASAGCAGVDPAVPASVIPFLAISTTYNAATALYRGIELSGRYRFNHNVYADYTYDVQSSVQNGIPDNILKGNPFIVNGGQIAFIPTHQASFGLDWSNHEGWEARLDTYWTGDNNTSERPAYSISNGFISKILSKKLKAAFGVSNVFNGAASGYGYFGHQLFIPENQFFSDKTPIQQYVNTGSGEQFGVPSRAFLFTLSANL
ncbi:MAG: hypothetical protein NVS9B12_00290 [Vulcanimicrobiaceae bacterium]